MDIVDLVRKLFNFIIKGIFVCMSISACLVAVTWALDSGLGFFGVIYAAVTGILTVCGILLTVHIMDRISYYEHYR